MRTDPRDVDGRSFDLVVIGGGIQGAALAREAAARGHTTLLVERTDFACGTSSRSSRLVHGGVRYLEQGHLSLVREALHERERLLRLAPHLVRPLPVLMPFYPDGGKSSFMLKLGLRLYGWMAGRSTMPRPRSVRPAECARLFPGIRERDLRGGMLYFDATTQDTRLTLAVLESAAQAGAVLLNHVEVVGASNGRLTLLDRVREREIGVLAKHVINAAGPGVDRVRRVLGIDGEDLVRSSRGSHLVFDPIDCETSLAAFLPDGRIQFVVPHIDGTLCGTTDVHESADVHPTVPAEDVDYLLEALAYMLEVAPDAGDVRYAYSGWRSLPAGNGPPGAMNREAFTVVEPSAAGAVRSVVGGKLTTHRSFAERVIQEIGGHSSPSPTRDQPLPGGGGAHDVSDPLWWRHGSRASDLRILATHEPELLQPLCPHRPFLRVEAVHAAQTQGVVTFSDLAVRRLVDSRGPCLEGDCLREMHNLFARELGASDWERDRAALVDEVRRGIGAAGDSR